MTSENDIKNTLKNIDLSPEVAILYGLALHLACLGVPQSNQIMIVLAPIFQKGDLNINLNCLIVSNRVDEHAPVLALC